MIILFVQSDKNRGEREIKGRPCRKNATDARHSAGESTRPDRKTAHRAAACPDRYPVMPASRPHSKKPPALTGGSLCDAWQFPTLAWGDPTLPSALRRFTSEFGMGSGGTTALSPPGKFFSSPPSHYRATTGTNPSNKPNTVVSLTKTPSVL